MDKLLSGKVDIFTSPPSNSSNPEAKLFSAFTFSCATHNGVAVFAREEFDEYLSLVRGKGGFPVHFALLLESRLVRREDDMKLLKLKQFVCCEWRRICEKHKTDEVVKPFLYLLSPAEKELLKSSSKKTTKLKSDVTISAPSAGIASGPLSASQEWEAHVKKGGKSSQSMSELMDLVGMEEVKRQALQVFKMMEAWAELPVAARVPVTLNFVFLGNPGTGKTTVARIFGKFLHEIKVRRKDVFVEKTATELKREGGKAFSDVIKSCLGGVLFIDEAYQLDPAKDPVGRDIVDELLTAAENHREDMTIILAGYKDDIEQKLFGYNSGMSSRFEEVTFSDFHDGQLRDIWDRFLRRHEWHVSEPNVSNVAVRRVARLRNKKGFGNARAVRAAFQSAVKTATTRWSDDRSATRQCITMEDVIGVSPSRHTLPELDSALHDLEGMVGLLEVKKAIEELVSCATINYKREILGQTVLSLNLNRLLLGNPGTGKTTVATIYGRVLKSLGLLTKGTVELRTASDFVGEVVGQSASKTKSILEICKGKVLVIDEAYSLNDSLYGKQVLDTIVEKVLGQPGEDIAVLMLGYEKEMRDMLRVQNPGLSRRFNVESALMFRDYDDTALASILVDVCNAENLKLSLPVLRASIRVLARQRSLPNFGNAGAVRNLLSAAKARMMNRLGDAFDCRLELVDVLGEKRNAYGGSEDQDALEPLRELYAGDKVLKKFEDLRRVLTVNRREGKDLSTGLRNWLFLGNPGTGKTTVANCMGRMLYDLGIIPRESVVVTSASDLTGKFVGEAKTLVSDALERSRGGVLFIDEAYELGVGQYGQEALTKLVEMLTLPDIKNSTVVVLAGYESNMRDMLSRNQGLQSRMHETIVFPDWSAEDASGFVLNEMKKDGYRVGDGIPAALNLGFSQLCGRPGWANARDALTVWRDRILWERAKRVHDCEESLASVTLEDVTMGLKSLLSVRPLYKGSARRQAFYSAYQQEPNYITETKMNFSPPSQRGKEQHMLEECESSECSDTNVKPAEMCSEENKDDLLSEDERLKLLREGEELQRKEEARLLALREEEARLRREEERAKQLQDEEKARQLRAAMETNKREREKKEKALRIHEKLRQMGICPAGFHWLDQGNGWYRCSAGGHTAHIDNLGL